MTTASRVIPGHQSPLPHPRGRGRRVRASVWLAPALPTLERRAVVSPPSCTRRCCSCSATGRRSRRNSSEQALDVALPAWTEARIESADLSDLQAAEYRADLVVLRCDDLHSDRQPGSR